MQRLFICHNRVLFYIVLTVILWMAPRWASADTPVAIVRDLATTDARDYHLATNLAQGFTITLFVSFDKKVPSKDVDLLVAHLKDSASYSFVSDWPNTENIVAFSGDNPPFVLTDPPYLPTPDPSGDNTKTLIAVALPGVMRGRSRGEVHIAPMAEWKLQSTATAGNQAVARYVSGADFSLPKFQGKANLGYGEAGLSLDFNGSGLLQKPIGQGRNHITTLSVSGQIPLIKPFDTSSTAVDASRKVENTLELTLNDIGYRHGGSLEKFGLKVRSTTAFKGIEAVTYYAPFTEWFNQSRGFATAELELGYRTGNAEFTSLTTRAPDVGNFVGRLGIDLEWAPAFIGINKNLGQGLRFFVRGRGWLDTFNESNGTTTVRFRPFFDSEIFYNFNSNSRVFLRGESGYLPPDLSLQKTRVYFGVGQAF